MKKTLVFSLLVMIMALSACGGKDNKSGNSGSFSSNLSTQNGFLNLSTQMIEVGGTTYPPRPEYIPIVNAAIAQAQMQNIQPVLISGAYKLRARITGQIDNYHQSYPGTPQYGGQQGGGLLITGISFY